MNYHGRKSRNENLKEDITSCNVNSDEYALIKNELDTLNSQKMYDNLNDLLESIQSEIGRKFENSKYINKIKDIFENKFSIIRDYFLRCMKHTDEVKLSTLDHLENIVINKPKQTHDEQLVIQINSLSTIIKELMKNMKNNLKQSNNYTELTHQQLLIMKTTISDFNMQYTSNKTSHIQGNKEKLSKDKLSICLDNIEALSLIRNNITKSLKNMEVYNNNFYEDAKLIFKKLKEIHNDKLSEISDNQMKHFQTEEDAFSNKVNKTRNNTFKKRDHSLDIKRSLMDISWNDNRNNEINKINELNKRNQELIEEISSLHENYLNLKYENINLRQEIENLGKDVIQEEHNHSYSCLNVVKLSESIINFIKHMNVLQDAISKKQSDIKDLKINFEKMKKEIYKMANKCIQQADDDQLIEFINIHSEFESIKQERDNLYNEINTISEGYNENLNLLKKYEDDYNVLKNEMNNMKIVNENLLIEKGKSDQSKDDMYKLKTLNSNLENLVKNLGEDIEKKNNIIINLNKKIERMAENDSYKHKYDEILKLLDRNKEENKHNAKIMQNYEKVILNIEKHIKDIESFNIDIYEEFEITPNEDVDIKIGKISKGLTEILNKLNENFENIEKELLIKNKEISDLRQEMEEKNNYQQKMKKDYENRIKYLENDLKTINEKYIQDQDNNSINQESNEINDLKQKNSMLSEYIEQYEKEVKEYQNRIRKYEEKIKQNDDRYDNKLNDYECKYKELEKKNKELNQAIIENNRSIKEKEEVCLNMEKEISNLNTKHEKLLGDIQIKSNIINEGYKNQVNELNKYIKNLELTIDEYKSNIENINKEISEGKIDLEKSKTEIGLKEKHYIKEIERLNNIINQKDERNNLLESIALKYNNISSNLNEKTNKEMINNDLDKINEYQMLLNQKEEEIRKFIKIEESKDLELSNTRSEKDKLIIKIKSLEERINSINTIKNKLEEDNQKQLEYIEELNKNIDLLKKKEERKSESSLNDLKKIQLEYENKLKHLVKENEAKCLKLNEDLSAKEKIIDNNTIIKNQELDSIKQKLRTISETYEDKISNYEKMLNNLKISEEKLKSMNLQLTSKINQLTLENTEYKDEIEKIDNNFSIVITHINTFFENIIKAIFLLKSETGIVFSEEIEDRLKFYEENTEEQYNLDNLEKDLEYAFIIVTDVFTQYQSNLTKLNESQDLTQFKNVIMKQ